jgi:hypothetical protein
MNFREARGVPPRRDPSLDSNATVKNAKPFEKLSQS